MKKDFLQVQDFSAKEIQEVLQMALAFKKGKLKAKPLIGKTAALIFHKPSLRTRVSFEVGISRLGGSSIYLRQEEIDLGKRESIADVARVLSRYVGLIVIRTYSQTDVAELARWASCPVINALTDLSHPCQILGDLLTVYEKLKKREKFSIAYLGDGNNITNSWLELATQIPVDLRIGTSETTWPDRSLIEQAKKAGKSKISITSDPDEAVSGAEVLYTDVWASMGQKHLADDKRRQLAGFQVNSALLKKAAARAVVLHCLPANRGEEITDEVMDGPQSAVFDQAENRLWIQMGIINLLLKSTKKRK
ncbi:MAG TPA: ornithine carbamoyltransferase [candidate division Zixibacteria bacterium]|nr:ornithine carbamoyltransferase [candidate division Zixibacteria bacterium]